jgi:hypothetical protein
MATIEVEKLVVLRACKKALDELRDDFTGLYDAFYREGLKRKTFWTRRPYTEAEAKQYANAMIWDDDWKLFHNWQRQDILQIQRTAESAKDTIILNDREVACIDKYWEWK